MPDLVLPCIYYCRPHCTAYLLPYLSSVIVIIPHLFCCPHRIASPPHLCSCCLSCLTSPWPYPLPSLSTVPVISYVCFRCTYQPDSTLYFPSDVVCIIPHLCLRHPCYPTSLPHLCCRCLCRCRLHPYASLSPHSLHLFPTILEKFIITPPPPSYHYHSTPIRVPRL